MLGPKVRRGLGSEELQIGREVGNVREAVPGHVQGGQLRETQHSLPEQKHVVGIAASLLEVTCTVRETSAPLKSWRRAAGAGGGPGRKASWARRMDEKRPAKPRKPLVPFSRFKLRPRDRKALEQRFGFRGPRRFTKRSSLSASPLHVGSVLFSSFSPLPWLSQLSGKQALQIQYLQDLQRLERAALSRTDLTASSGCPERPSCLPPFLSPCSPSSAPSAPWPPCPSLPPFCLPGTGAHAVAGVHVHIIVWTSPLVDMHIHPLHSYAHRHVQAYMYAHRVRIKHCTCFCIL